MMEKCFYLTDEECKELCAQAFKDAGICFYLTDEECKEETKHMDITHVSVFI